MSGEQQLERSVLERKERDELQQIASAMGLTPASRTSKANLVTQILRATGVDVDADSNGAPDKPKRTRRKATDAAEGGSGVVDGSESTSAVSASAVSANGGSAEAASSDGASVESPSANGRASSSLAEPAPARAPRSSQLAAPAPAPAQADNAESNGRAGRTGAGDGGDAASTESGSTSGESTSAPQGRDGQSGDRQPRDRQQGQGQGQGQGQNRDRQGGQNQQGQSQQNRQQQNQQYDGGQGDLGNRRNRRRRGRDRERGPGGGGGGIERDLQGSGQEPVFQGEPVPVSGLLDLRDEGFGFLRTSGFLASQKDVYVSISQVRRFALRKGDYVEGASRPAATNEKYPALLRIDTVSGMTPDEARLRPRFEDLTPLFPDEKLRLELPGDPANTTARIVDLISPIGKGQRGLIVSPPKAGKTTIMKQVAHSIEANNPGVHLMVLLVDERPEEVTDMRRSVKGEVVASTFDRPSDEHTQVAELTIERAKRLVEVGTDVVIILDGITRLARAYNLAAPATGRIMSGGIDTGALYPPKKFFGAARNIEEGGSLTILATALVETGSKMDEVIFEEFKGTGNMELRLDRRLAEKRVYPAIDVNASSTRHEELLFERTQLQQVWKLRRVLNAMAADGNAAPGLELLIDRIKTTASNDEFLAEIAKGPTPPV
ncbi:MAG: transcription termination factor Rho [Acidimicrobiaceae bacterium]|nr:transcription termination factor Rho [Acidimicrobiaceae bacterium]